MAAMDSNTTPQRVREDRAIYRAISLLEKRLREPGEAMSTTNAVRQFLALRLAQEEREVFSALWLDTQNRLIAADDLFVGTLAQTSVYPREVIKRCLQRNAAAVIFAHNHPSGMAAPSASDRMLTDVLKQALALVDVRVLDHFIVAGASALSMLEDGVLMDERPATKPETKPRRGRPRKAVQIEAATA